MIKNVKEEENAILVCGSYLQRDTFIDTYGLPKEKVITLNELYDLEGFYLKRNKILLFDNYALELLLSLEE